MSNENKNEQPDKKSARPRKITYVPIGDEELENTILPVKKKYKGLKITGIAAAMLVDCRLRICRNFLLLFRPFF